MTGEKPKADTYYGLAVLAGLAPQQPLTLLDPHLVENRVYKNQRITLDAYRFANCVFINCELHTSKGNFHLSDCHFSQCTINFSGSALRAVKLSSLLLGTWDQLNEGLRPLIEPDGGVTIP